MDATDSRAPFTVGVTTRNRPESLLRCLESLARLGDLVERIIVVDDTGDLPLAGPLASLPPTLTRKIDLVVQAHQQGYIVARNTIVKRAATRYVLLLDDDTYVTEPDPFRTIIERLDAYADIAAVACAQTTADGTPWAVQSQPSFASDACYIPSFIGFAHVVRRDVFLALGGYREQLHYFGEEKEFCLRLLDHGYRVLYMPSARVAHVPDPASRNRAKQLRYIVRNDCLTSLYNEPLPLAVGSIPIRLARYVRMRRAANVTDPGGLQWIVSGVAGAVPDIIRNRKPVSWASIRRWRRLRRAPEAFADSPC
jgi:GT2 family glycosyltransferase